MEAIKSFLSGRKTYIVAFLMVLVSVISAVTGDVSWAEVLESEELFILLNGLGLGTLRAGVAKAQEGQ